MRRFKQFISIVMFVALFDALLGQFLFWTNEAYQTQLVANRIASGALLAFAGLILLTTIWNNEAIKKENS